MSNTAPTFSILTHEVFWILEAIVIMICKFDSQNVFSTDFDSKLYFHFFTEHKTFNTFYINPWMSNAAPTFSILTHVFV